MSISFGDSLAHHGILGQRWGIRRYQNKDGSLTSLGKRRLGVTSDEKVIATPGQVEQLHAASARRQGFKSNSLAATSQLADRGSKMASIMASKEKSQMASEIDLSEVSDGDLQKLVNRMNLERNYRAMSVENVRTGKDKAAEFLSYAGDIAAIGASAASIAMAIHSMKANK